MLDIPFDSRRGNQGRPRLGVFKQHLPSREHLDLAVAHQTNIQFPTLDECLNQRVGSGLAMNKVDSLLELFRVIYDAGFRNPQRCVFRNGLYQQWKFQRSRFACFFTAWSHEETWRTDLMKGQNLFRKWFVVRQ